MLCSQAIYKNINIHIFWLSIVNYTHNLFTNYLRIWAKNAPLRYLTWASQPSILRAITSAKNKLTTGIGNSCPCRGETSIQAIVNNNSYQI